MAVSKNVLNVLQERKGARGQLWWGVLGLVITNR